MKPLVTRMELDDALQTFFNQKHGYVDYPQKCNWCGEEVHKVSGAITHLKKKHKIYISTRSRGLIRQKKQILNQFRKDHP